MLISELFRDDPLLEAIAADQDRISRTRHRNDPAVRKVQTALLGWDPTCLPRFGADGDYGDETAGAVARFKVEVLGVPPAEVIDDVGPQTVIRLDAMRAAAEHPVPSVAPEDWLLDAGQLGPFRTPAFTLDNLVLFFVDGQDYLEELASQLDALAAGDRVLFAGWRFSPEQRLNASNPAAPGVLDRLVRLRNTGITVRALVYGSVVSTLPVRKPAVPAFPSKDNFDFRTGLVNAGAQAVLDARVGRFGSHHQKCVVVQSAAQGPAAFLGGIDVCLDRYDNAAHVDLPARQREPDFLGVPISQPNWHDLQCGVFGPAVNQIFDALAQRWNDPGRPSSIDPVAPPPIPPGEAPGPPVTSGTHAVQVLRTLTCGGVYSFLPGGEFTVVAAYRKAIRRARHYIYIEDQYLWPSALVDDLRDAAARGVQLVFVTARDYDIPLLSNVHKQMREETLIRVASGNPANVRLFHLERAASALQIYVHAKLMIVDDQYVAAGSANLNFRSHTTDSELHLGIFDTELVAGPIGGTPGPVGRAIRDLRAQLWGEHLNEDPALHEDPIAGIARMPGAGNKIGHLVSSPIPAQPRPVDYRELLREILRTIQQMEQWQVLAPVILGPLAIPVQLVPGLDLGTLADLVPNPAAVVRDILNPNTICP